MTTAPKPIAPRTSPRISAVAATTTSTGRRNSIVMPVRSSRLDVVGRRHQSVNHARTGAILADAWSALGTAPIDRERTSLRRSKRADAFRLQSGRLGGDLRRE